MIYAEEIMIGDWIQTNCTIFKVEGFDTSSGEVQSKSWAYDLDNCKPIEITPEILKENGFELKPDGWLWHEFFGNEYQNYIFIQFRKGCKEVRTCELNFTNKVFLSFKPRYIHELQHALRLCGIDKEIEL